MANAKEAINDDFSKDDRESIVNALKERLDQEVNQMNNRIQMLSDENEVLKRELKQVKENLVRSVEGEGNNSTMINQDLQDHEENLAMETLVENISAEENSVGENFVGGRSAAVNNNRRRLGIFRPKSILAFLQRKMNTEVENSIYNTGTIHMHAVVVTATCISKPNPIKSWLWAWASMLLICCQIAVLRWLIFESSYITCTTHTDCEPGEFCYHETRDFLHPRCLDCEFKLDFWDDVNKEISEVDEGFCHDFIEQEPPFDEIDHNVVWFKKNEIHHSDDRNITDPRHAACYANAYCDRMAVAKKDLFDNKICDHVKLKTSKLSTDQIIIFIMVAIVFSSTLCVDIEEASVEEKILSFSRKLVGDGHYMPGSAYLLLYSLRIRRYMLPWMYASATVSIMISEDFSASNILLNILAVGFLTEADDMLGTLVLSKRRLVMMGEFVEMAKCRGVHPVSFFWTRVIGICASILIVIVTFALESFEPFLGNDDGVCSDIHNVKGTIFSVIVPSCFILIHGSGYQYFVLGKRYDDRRDKILDGIREMSISLVAFCFTNTMIFISSAAIYTFRGLWEQDAFEIRKEWGLAVFIGTLFFIYSSIYAQRKLDTRETRRKMSGFASLKTPSPNAIQTSVCSC